MADSFGCKKYHLGDAAAAARAAIAAAATSKRSFVSFQVRQVVGSRGFLGQGSIRRCAALDSTGGGTVVWIGMGCPTCIGGLWIGIFLLISSGIIYVYYALILKVDEEDYGGHGALLQEGLFASITVFLLAWTLVYSLAHF